VKVSSGVCVTFPEMDRFAVDISSP